MSEYIFPNMLNTHASFHVIGPYRTSSTNIGLAYRMHDWFL